MSREDDGIVGALVDLCRRHQIKCTLQVGAEDGYEAHRLNAETGCRAVGIEPDMRCTNKCPGVQFFHYLIGATNSISEPFYIHANGGLSSVFPRGDGEEIVQRVQLRLDTFCEMHNVIPDCLIIDTEGSTLDVLEGSEQTLKNVRVVYAEVQGYVMRPGIRPYPMADEFMVARGFTAHTGPPSYGVGGSQGNATWVKP